MLDEMAIHMVRLPTSSTIISYHSQTDWHTTTAKELHKLVRLAGQSVYWRKIFQKSDDPTFVVLTMLWHAIYSWDEALSSLYTHIQSLVGGVDRLILYEVFIVVNRKRELSGQMKVLLHRYGSSKRHCKG